MRELTEGEIIMTKQQVKDFLSVPGNFVKWVENDPDTGNFIVMTYKSYMKVNYKQIRAFELMKKGYRGISKSISQEIKQSKN